MLNSQRTQNFFHLYANRASILNGLYKNVFSQSQLELRVKYSEMQIYVD